MDAVGTEALDIISLRPADTPDSMTDAWLGCIHWALGQPDIVDAFRADTGIKWRPGQTPIERMIDQAADAEREFIERFIRWANVKVWGPL